MKKQFKIGQKLSEKEMKQIKGGDSSGPRKCAWDREVIPLAGAYAESKCTCKCSFSLTLTGADGIGYTSIVPATPTSDADCGKKPFYC